MINVIEAAQASSEILIPKGDDNKPCIDAFQEVTGIEVPFPDGRKLQAASQGRTFTFVKGKDIPGMVSANQITPDIGVTGFDSYLEFAGLKMTNLAYQEIGAVMCRFSLLTKESDLDRMRNGLNRNAAPTEVSTSFPQLLGVVAAAKDINVVAAETTVSGSVEAMPWLTSKPTMVADLVSSGETATDNGLVVERELLPIRPVLLAKDGEPEMRQTLRPFAGIQAIDATLRKRLSQAQSPENTSYSIEMLRNPNARGKKVGEEVAEFLMSLASGTTQEQVNELADLLIAGVYNLVAESDGDAGLADVVEVLVARNRKAEAKQRWA